MAIAHAIAHVKYIQHRPGEDRGDGGREFFNATDDHVDAKMLRNDIRDYKGSGTVAHKLTISPEVTPSDMKTFTREMMHELETDTGRDLEWYAVEHRNTEHHHLHVVILGKDALNRPLRLAPKDYRRMKEAGDRYLERMHPFEFREAERLRQEKSKERADERKRVRELERQERIQRGEELPWLHRKIVREQLEPYQKWRENFDKHPEADKQNVALSKEAADRQRFDGEVERQLEFAKHQQSASEKFRNSPATNRYVSPVQQELLKNPIMGLFLTEAAIAAELVRSIELTDKRDHAKIAVDELHEGKRDSETRHRERTDQDGKQQDEEVIRKMEQAIDDIEEQRKQVRKRAEKQRDRRDRDVDFLR